MKKFVFLITGACGFIGSHMIDCLFAKYPHKDQLEIIVVDKMSYCSTLNNIPKEKVVFYHCNIQNDEMIYFILQKHQVTHVLHFAAESHVDNSFNNSILFTKENVLGTHVLIEQCRRYNKLELFLHVSTDEVYGETLELNSVSEDSLLMPTNPYAASKAAAEFVVQSYIRSYKIPAIIIRMNNVFGPRQFPEKVIPKFIMLALQEKPLTIQGNGNQLRAFIFVSDVCEAIYKVLESGKQGQVYNIGTPNELSVLQIAEKIYQTIHKKSPPLKYEADRIFNDKRYFINSDKLTKLGWNLPNANKFDEDLGKTIDWYKNHLDWFKS